MRRGGPTPSPHRPSTSRARCWLAVEPAPALPRASSPAGTARSSMRSWRPGLGRAGDGGELRPRRPYADLRSRRTFAWSVSGYPAPTSQATNRAPSCSHSRAGRPGRHPAGLGRLGPGHHGRADGGAGGGGHPPPPRGGGPPHPPPISWDTSAVGDSLVIRAREHNLTQRQPRAAAREADRVHRAVGVGQVVAGLRHHLRRGPAPLRRVAVGLRPPVPRADGQARRRLHRGPVAGHLHRPEERLPQPALDRRHDHRGLRLPAPAVRPHRRAALPRVRRRGHPPDAAADRRPHHGAARRHPVPGAGAGGAGPQGHLRDPAGRPGRPGLRPGPGRRRGARDVPSGSSWPATSSTPSR